MLYTPWPRCPSVSRNLILTSLLFAATKAELFLTASSPQVHDGLIRTPPTVCPVAQDGYTSNTFPWTHNPTCVNAVLPNPDDSSLGIHQTFCVFTNANYNNGRGISLVVSPEVAASINSETFGMGVGGLDGQIGEEMGMWEMKETEEKGIGLFAKKDTAAIFAGESLIIKTPVLLVAKQLLDTPSTSRRQLVLERAVAQLPGKTRDAVLQLYASAGNVPKDIISANANVVRWPMVDEVPQLLAITPEVARINHACRPNAMWRFNDYTLAFEMLALKDIKPGEEITMSYGFERRSHRRRIRSLEDNFGFTCLCPLCTANETAIEESNDRLSEIKALKSVLPTAQEDTPQLLGLLPNLITQMEEEDLHTELPMYEEILAYAWSSFGIEVRAKYWAGRARRHWAVLAGKDSWEQKRCADLENDVKGHATWMSWEGDPWEGVGQGHPWDEKEGEEHHHGHEHDHDHSHE